MSNAQELELEIFRAGNYGGKGKFSEADLDQIAADYNPQLHEAPVTIDHQQSGPAFGWVATLRRQGDRLLASLRNLNDEFLKLLRSGAFKKRSIELYPKFAQTGRPYLRALTFLGARLPEVKGLADVKFNDDANYEIIDFADADTPQVAHMEVLKQAREQIVRLQEEKHRVEDELQKLRRSLVQQNLLHFCEELKRQGKFLPAWEKQGILKFMEILPDSDAVQFAEDDSAALTPLQWFENFLSSLPQLIPLQEVAPAEPVLQMAEDHIPRSTSKAAISQRSIELHRRVVAIRQQRPELSYSDALRHILRNS